MLCSLIDFLSGSHILASLQVGALQLLTHNSTAAGYRLERKRTRISSLSLMRRGIYVARVIRTEPHTVSATKFLTIGASFRKGLNESRALAPSR